VPARDDVRLDEIEDVRRVVSQLDWKVQDVVVIVTASLPDEAEPATRQESHEEA
jgi:hypothetical protein